MKINYILCWLGIVCLLPHLAFAQISQGGEPVSFSMQLKSNPKTVLMPNFDLDKMLQEDAQDEATGGVPFRFAKPFAVNYNLNNSGTWETLSNGDRIWRLKIQSPRAHSLNVIFDDYHLPESAKLFLYNADRTHVLGAFTAANNKESRHLPTAPVAGDILIIEYFEPTDVAFRGQLQIGQVAHDYKGIFSKLEQLEKDWLFGSSNACNIDINCVQGNAWQDEKRAVCRIIINGGGLCSGSLVNNTSQDGTPYFLTADHCVNTQAEATSLIFYFNYESPTCGGGDGQTNQTISSSTLRANHPNSDFALLEMSAIPPASYNAYYLGWNNVNTAATSSTGIHHPAGDVKKISVDNDAAANAGFNINWNDGVTTPPNTHWQVGFDQGATDGGSSGSPLLDQNSRVVGQLHGGGAGCPAGSAFYYGKFSYSWNNFSAANQQLAVWLDPIGTGANTLNGAYITACAPSYTFTSPNNDMIEGNFEIANKYEASDFISASNVIDDAVVIYDAGNYIELLPGFVAQTSGNGSFTPSPSSFEAYIDGCGGSKMDEVQTKPPTTSTTIEPMASITPQTPALQSIRNYPNPFTHCTTIEYILQEDTRVDLRVFDVAGRQVAHLVENVLQARGTYQTQFDGRDLPIGMYYYTIRINNQIVSQKMVISR